MTVSEHRPASLMDKEQELRLTVERALRQYIGEHPAPVDRPHPGYIEALSQHIADAVSTLAGSTSPAEAGLTSQQQEAAPLADREKSAARPLGGYEYRLFPPSRGERE